MDTYSFKKQNRLVGEIEQIFNLELDAVDPALRTPEERHQSIAEGIESRKPELIIDPNNVSHYGKYALSDMWLISRSALNYLVSDGRAFDRLEDDPLTTMIRSVEPLSFPGFISDYHWNNLKTDWKKEGESNGMLLPQKIFDLLRKDGHEQQVMFSTGVQLDISDLIDVTGNSGCPAKGIILNRVFAKYIDTIYRGTTLTQEIQ